MTCLLPPLRIRLQDTKSGIQSCQIQENIGKARTAPRQGPPLYATSKVARAEATWLRRRERSGRREFAGQRMSNYHIVAILMCDYSRCVSKRGGCLGRSVETDINRNAPSSSSRNYILMPTKALCNSNANLSSQKYHLVLMVFGSSGG